MVWPAGLKPCSPRRNTWRAAEHKSAYYRGEVFAMSGASRAHNVITTNVAAAFHIQLRERPCEVYASDMRVKVSGSGLYTYPDVIDCMLGLGDIYEKVAFD